MWLDASVMLPADKTIVSEAFPTTATGIPQLPEVPGGVGNSPPLEYGTPVVPWHGNVNGIEPGMV